MTQGYRTTAACLLALLLAAVCAGQRQGKNAPGGVRGKVRVDESTTPAGVTVTVLRGDEEVARAETDRKGQYEITGLAPGVYSLTFRKAGLKTAELKPYEIRPGKIGSLGDRVYLDIDEGSIVFLKGTVFNSEGRSVANARVELLLLAADGTERKVDGRVSSESGQFSFRLKPEPARYRVAAKLDGRVDSKIVEIEGAMIYRVALSLKPAP
jgi:hypothetical protein